MKTILLVDDSQLLVRTYSMALRKAGYNVIEADSGVTGLTMARTHLPDLIISDIDMPDGDGATLLREIRRDPELKSKQVVLMTGRPDLITPRQGMEEGADDFLLKPVALETLLSCAEARFRRAAINWRVGDQMLAQCRSSVPPQLPQELFIPMAGIIGLMQILRSDLTDFTTAEISDFLNEMYKSALRVQRTLRNYLLIIDRQDAIPELAPPLSPEQVEDCIQDGIHEVLRQHTRRADVGFWMNTCSISVKPEDLVYIVEELVDNACKFSREGTAVKVEMGKDGRLTISDKGRGMTVEEINNIGAFNRADANKLEQHGLGLGLVLVDQLIDLSGAKFVIRSHLGEGTQVQIAFKTSDNGSPPSTTLEPS